MAVLDAAEGQSGAVAGVAGEHRLQVGLLAAFREALAAGRPANEVEEILDQLIEFTKIHFASEQLLMRLHRYPAYEDHEREHDDMVDQAIDLRERYRSGDAEAAALQVNALSRWLIGHIQRTDQALERYLAERQVKT